MFFVYILRNYVSQKRYIGQTSNVDKRLRQHNSQHKGFTSQKGKWELIYVEEYESRNDALLREKFLKSGQGREFLDKIGK